MKWCFPLPSFFGLLLLLGGAVCCSSVLSGAASSSFSGGAVSLIGLWVVLGLTSLEIQECRGVRTPNLWGRWILGCCFFCYWNYVSCCLGLWALELSLSLTVAMVLLLEYAGFPPGASSPLEWCFFPSHFGRCCFGWCCCPILLWCGAGFSSWVVLPSPPPFFCK